MDRREFVSSAAAAALLPVLSRSSRRGFAGEGQPTRPFSWRDAERRINVGQLAVCQRTGKFALQVMRPLCAGGPYLGPALARPDLDPRGELWLLDEHLGEPKQLSSEGRGVWSPTFSPDGTHLAALTLSGPGKVGLAVWNLAIGNCRLFLNHNIEVFFTTFRSADSEYAGISRYPIRIRYLWLKSNVILFVDHGDTGQEGFLEPASLPSAERSLRDLSRSGRTSVRVWSDESPTCGHGAFLATLDCTTGETERLHGGDIRGVSVSPDGRLAALLVAMANITPPANVAMRAPLGAGEFDEALVRTELVIAPLESKGPTQRVERVSTVGAIPPWRLPVWSEDGDRVAVPTRLTYSDRPSTGNDAVWAVDGRGRSLQKWDAHSALDAELVAAMVTTEGLHTAPVLAARPTQVRLTDYTLGRIQGGAWRCSPTQVLFWNAPSLILIGPAAATCIPGRFVSVSAPVRTGTVTRTLVARDDNTSAVLSFWPHRWRTENLRGNARWRVLGARATDGGVVYVDDGNSGTFLLLERQGERPRTSPLSFNTYFREVAQPQSIMISHTFPDGAVRAGELLLPIGHRDGDRHPVIIYAYPDFMPSVTSAISRPNSALSVVYPVQYLLASGFAFFHAPFPTGGRAGSEPVRASAAAVLPWLDVLNNHESVLPGAFGFWGHSNAGFVALALEAQTRRFKAIVAWDTFPEIGFGDLHASAFDVTLSCAGQLIQQNRFLYEDPEQPFHPQPAPPWKEARSYIRNDPLFNLEEASTPLLLVEGEYDFSPQGTEEVYSILRARGVPVELAYYWGEDHVFGSPGNIRDSWMRTERFFSKYLRGRA